MITCMYIYIISCVGIDFLEFQCRDFLCKTEYTCITVDIGFMLNLFMHTNIEIYAGDPLASRADIQQPRTKNAMS